MGLFSSKSSESSSVLLNSRGTENLKVPPGESAMEGILDSEGVSLTPGRGDSGHCSALIARQSESRSGMDSDGLSSSTAASSHKLDLNRNDEHIYTSDTLVCPRSSRALPSRSEDTSGNTVQLTTL